MVDGERQRERLRRLDRLIQELERIRAGGEDAYLTDARLRHATERELQLALQICIDIGAHLVSEIHAPVPSDYAAVFASLGQAGVLEGNLSSRLEDAAKLRNLLVHAYLDLDDRRMFAALERLGDLRAFAAAVARLVEESD